MSARWIVALAIALVAISFAPAAAAFDCYGHPECCKANCDDFCCYSTFMEFCTNDSCSNAACVDSCAYCQPGCPSTGNDGGFQNGNDGGRQDAGPPRDPTKTCYVFVHGSAPGQIGPAVQEDPAVNYFGTGDGATPDDKRVGQFIQSMLTGKRVDAIAPPATSFDGKSFAVVSYDSTWPYYWAAVDVLQQLDTIERGGTPVSLEWTDDKAGNIDPTKRHAEGINGCNDPKYIVLVGHSMGNVIVSFLLGNMQPDALNFDFLRRGGLNTGVPYFQPATGTWITDPKDAAAAYFNHVIPTKDKVVPWAKPLVREPGGQTIDPPNVPPSASTSCFYPSAAALTATAGQVFPAVTSGTCRDAASILAPVTYAYSIDGPLRGTPIADCMCGNEIPSDAPTVCKALRPYAECLFGRRVDDFDGGVSAAQCAALDAIGNGIDFVFHNAIERVAHCNMAVESMQTGGAYLVQNAAGVPGRAIYVVGGTDPGEVLAGTTAFRPLDCLAKGDCRPFDVPLQGLIGDLRGGDDGFPSPLNDTVVPLSSAMGCNVNPWQTPAKISVKDQGSAAFASPMCVGNDKIWPGVVRNDFVTAATHTGARIGVVRREAYAPTQSFWSNVINPVLPGMQLYAAGDSLVFGVVDGFDGPSPFYSRPSWSQASIYVCEDGDDQRRRFEGCSPARLRTWNGVGLMRQHRSVAHICGIEERYVERQNRVW